MGSENDKTRKGVWNETGRYLDGSKSLKRQKSPTKSFVWTDELKRQFTYTLKPSKCSNTDIAKSKIGNGDAGEERGSQEATPAEIDRPKPQNKAKNFADMNIENIFQNSEYFKFMSGDTASVSFCSGENGENRWTIDTKNQAKKIVAADQASEETTRTKKNVQNTGFTTQAEELKYLRHGIDAVLAEIKQLSRDFELVRMDLKTVENLIRFQKQVPGKARQNKKEGIHVEDINLKLGKFSEEVEKAALELKDFIDINRTLLTENEDIPKCPDLDKIISNLHRLSETAYQPKITQTSMGAKFETSVVINLGFGIRTGNLYPDKLPAPLTAVATPSGLDRVLPRSGGSSSLLNNHFTLSDQKHKKSVDSNANVNSQAPRELPISFYADGILLRNKEFRKFTDMKAGLFLRDIEDGFFPSELWPEFPYGVPFQVTDRRFELFGDANLERLNKFPGNGRRLGMLFDGKPPAMVYLKPAKSGCVEMDYCDPGKRRINSFTDYKTQARAKNASQSTNEIRDRGREEPGDIPRLMSLKVRVGIGKEGMIHVNIMSNEKMSRFQDILFAKLCERYHNEYIKNMDIKIDNSDNKFGETVPDFEIHAYGQKPFRLSEKLNQLPSECGIVDDCVINITEI